MNVSVAVFDAAFAQFNLRAGSGGRYDDTYGGGGGGIEVEGFSASRTNGGGFGAGGAYSRGTSGLVLVEVLSSVRQDAVHVINDDDICSSPPTTNTIRQLDRSFPLVKNLAKPQKSGQPI